MVASAALSQSTDHESTAYDKDVNATDHLVVGAAAMPW